MDLDEYTKRYNELVLFRDKLEVALNSSDLSKEESVMVHEKICQLNINILELVQKINYLSVL